MKDLKDNTQNSTYQTKIISRSQAISEGLSYFYTGRLCKWGHDSERYTSSGGCVECRRLKNNSEEHRRYDKSQKRIEDKKKYKKTVKYKNQQKVYRSDNKDSLTEYQRNYQKSSKYKLKRSERNKKRYENDPLYRTTVTCRNMLHRVLDVTKTDKESSTWHLLGYQPQEFFMDIDSKLLEGMTWDNHGDVWHIDHIYPVSRYAEDGVEDPKIINALSNLIPMFKQHNLDKSNSTLEEYVSGDEHLTALYGEHLNG